MDIRFRVNPFNFMHLYSQTYEGTWDRNHWDSVGMKQRGVQRLRGTFLRKITLDVDAGNAFPLKSLRCFGK